MGIVLAASARIAGNTVLWASRGRSALSAKRAAEAGLQDAGRLEDVVAHAEIILSVCPPEFAEEIARQVQAAGFRGIFVDANAISPQRAQRMAANMEASGIPFVDGGIIGLAPTDGLDTLKPGQVWLHVSGPRADRIAECMANGPVTIDVLGEEPGKASALKMCYAAFNKGATALAAAVSATASRLGVYEELVKQWDRTGPKASVQEERILRAAPKAWRWVAEMHEIADTLDAAGLPAEFHEAAAEVYERLREMKDRTDSSMEEVARRLLMEPED